MILDASFFKTNNVVDLAKNLIGKIVHTNINKKKCSAMIVETEAYDGLIDQASHAYGSRITNRTKIFYENGGKIYVYLCYGIHNMFNIISGDKKHPNAVLIRAVSPILGIKHMIKRRESNVNVTNGPGKLCQALGINLTHNNTSIFSKTIYIEDNIINPKNIVTSKRVGIDYAGKDADLPWRFYLKNNIDVSRF